MVAFRFKSLLVKSVKFPQKIKYTEYQRRKRNGKKCGPNRTDINDFNWKHTKNQRMSVGVPRFDNQFEIC